MSAIDAACTPRLARGVRLRLDRITGKTLLLRPERGFELQGSAVDIVRLCTARLTVGAIVDRLTAAHPEVPRAQIEDDVGRLLTDLSGRGVIEWEAP